MLGIDARVARATWTAALVLLLLGAIYLIRQTLLVFVIALLFAYLLYPLMDLIDRRLPTKTRTPALALTYAVVMSVLAIFGILIGTVVARQAANLASAAPAFLARLQQTSPAPDASLRNLIVDTIRQHYGDLVSLVPQASLRVLSASWNLIYVVIIPILSFFILKDGRSIRDGFLEMFDSEREAAEDTLMDVHRLLLQYMRALLFLCCATFIMFAIVLSAMRVPYALLLASIAFPLEFVPLVGPLTAAAIVIAVSAIGGFPHLVLVIVFLGLFRLFQDYVLSPHLMSQGVELHPLMVVFGVFAGGEIGGVAGIFLSVPTLALVRLLYHRLGKIRAARRLQPAG